MSSKKNPLNLIRFFIEAERNFNLLLHPEALRLIRSSLNLIDDACSGRIRRPTSLFLDLLTSGTAPPRRLSQAYERVWRSGPLHSRLPARRGDDAVQYVSSLYHRRTHAFGPSGFLSEIEKRYAAAKLPPSTRNHRRYSEYAPCALSLRSCCTTSPKLARSDHSIVGARLGACAPHCD